MAAFSPNFLDLECLGCIPNQFTGTMAMVICMNAWDLIEHICICLCMHVCIHMHIEIYIYIYAHPPADTQVQRQWYEMTWFQWLHSCLSCQEITSASRFRSWQVTMHLLDPHTQAIFPLPHVTAGWSLQRPWWKSGARAWGLWSCGHPVITAFWVTFLENPQMKR